MNVSNKSLLNKVVNKRTYITNKWLLVTIFLFCFAVTVTTYYEQKHIQIRELDNNLKIISSKLNSAINTYKESLEALSYNNLWKSTDLSENEISQIIKSTKSDKLANVMWHPNNGTNKAFGIYGIVKHQLLFQNVCRGNILGHLRQTFNIQEYLDHNHQPVLLMLQKIKDEKHKTYGYLSLPIKLASLLERTSSRILDSEIIRFNSDEKSIFFDKSNQIFYLTNDTTEKLYIFSKNIKLNFIPYELTLGVSYKQIFEKVCHALYSRYILIIVLGSLLLLIYNLLERRRTNKIYQEEFAQEIEFLQNKLELQAIQQEKLYTIKQNFDALIHSNKILFNIQSEVNQDIKSTLQLLDGTNELLLKHCSGEKELEPEVIKKLFLTARNIVDDLSNNIYSKNNEHNQIDIETLIDEIIILFFPIINSRSLIINKDTKKLSKNTYINTNKIILEQVIINLLIRSVCSIIEGSTINIDIKKVDERVFISIIDDGFATDEKLFRNIAMNHNSYLPIANLYLELSTIKELILDIGVTLEIKSPPRNGNEYTLIMPINFYELYLNNDKIVPLRKPAYWK